MRTVSYAAFLLLASACDGGSYSTQQPFTGSDTADTGSGDTDTGGGDTDTADTDTDTDTDTVDTGDTDTDTDTDPPPSLCENAWYAIHYAPYHREYDMEINIASLGGGVGTGYQEDYGTAYDGAGNKVWAMIDSAEGGGAGWDGEEHIGCTNKKGEEGLFMEEWDMSLLMQGSAAATPVAEITPARKIFPAEYEVGGAGSWNYSDTANVTDSMGVASFTAESSGTYVDGGFEDIEIDGTTYHAYKLTNTYTTNISLMTGAQTINGQQTLWYVKGIGLVKEENVNTDDGSTIVLRTLTSFTGLSAE